MVLEHKFSYQTKNAMVIFKEDPDIHSIHELREFLDSLTDQLIEERLDAGTDYRGVSD